MTFPLPMVHPRLQINQLKGSLGLSQTTKEKKNSLEGNHSFIHFECSRAICLCCSTVPSVIFETMARRTDTKSKAICQISS